MKLTTKIMAVASGVLLCGSSMAGIVTTFDWEESNTTDWWFNGGYQETEDGVTMLSGGRAYSSNSGVGDGIGFKATYFQDAAPATFTMEVGGAAANFKVMSVAWAAIQANAPSGAFQLRGTLAGAEQWTIDPASNDGAWNTYTSATTGSLDMEIDTLVWDGAYDPAEPSTLLDWGNGIDNLTVDAVPEPATFGLVAIFGGAVVFVRRRLKI